ncbi:hypothetical protein GCM10010169_55730 [Micromonospora fulviviridis]|nr:hypothetical protein GCM10010169_55730 [Micromonospora fulviviridis]
MTAPAELLLLTTATGSPACAHRIERLEPEHLERFYRRMQQTGSAPATAHQVHRTIRTALNEAVRRGHLVKNPATLAKTPRMPEGEIEPYTVAEVQRLMAATHGRRNSARWAVALALGLRQGEALGLRRSDVDLDAGTLTVRRGRQRPRWEHGCRSPCGRKHGGHCPDRRQIRADTADTKSRAGRRSIGLPDELVALLRKHSDEQDQERATAAQLWEGGDWLFAMPTGGPVNPRTDYDEWKRVLKLAGLRDGRLHDARHTAGNRAADPRRGRARRDGHHGLVQFRDGGPVPTPHRPGPAGHCAARRRTALGQPAGEAEIGLLSTN